MSQSKISANDMLANADYDNLTIEEILTLLVTHIVSDPDAVEVTFLDGDSLKVVEFDVSPQDRGPLLGKDGRTLSAMRTLTKAMLGARVRNVRYNIGMVNDRQDGDY